jgi:hypothetical protein
MPQSIQHSQKEAVNPIFANFEPDYATKTVEYDPAWAGSLGIYMLWF